MEILLPEQTTAEDIVFWTGEIPNLASEKTARQHCDTGLG